MNPVLFFICVDYQCFMVAVLMVKTCLFLV